MHFTDQLVDRIHRFENPTCVGLDPRLSQIPSFIQKKVIKKWGKTAEAAAQALLIFNKGIVDAVADLVPALKLQIAFYEALGIEGLKVYLQTIEYAHKKGLLVIGDVKRSDIGSTAAAYAEGHLGSVDVFGKKIPGFKADAMTVMPYFGTEGIVPFTTVAQRDGKGLFVVVRSSNPSAEELQGVPVGDQLFDELVAGLVEGWGREHLGKSGFSLVGAVVGATYPEEARTLRQLMPHQLFLVPGYGAQGGNAKDVKPCFYANGTGAIVNSSRDIIFAYEKAGQPGEAYAEAAREAAIKMKKELAKMF